MQPEYYLDILLAMNLIARYYYLTARRAEGHKEAEGAHVYFFFDAYSLQPHLLRQTR
jgi:hypothetical protein